MTFAFDASYVLQIFNTADPFSAAWLLLKAGAWMPFLIVVGKGLSWAWQNERGGIFISQQKQVFLAIDVPKTNEQLPRAVENIFSHLQGAYSAATKHEKWFQGKTGPIFSFEIISIGGYVQFVVMSWEKYRDVIEALIYAQYPEAEITEIEDYTKFAPQQWPNKDHLLFGTEFVPKKSYYYPIKTYPDFADKISGEFIDPMANLLESLSKLKTDEQVWLQVLIQLGNQDWAKAGGKMVKKLIGGATPKKKPGVVEQVIGGIGSIASEFTSFGGPAAVKKEENKARSEMLFLSPMEKTVVEAVERKITQIGHNTKIRFIYFAPNTIARTSTIIAFVRGAFQQFTHHELNSFAFNGSVTTKRDYFFQMNSLYYYLSGTFYRTVNERMRMNFRGYKSRSLWTGGKSFVFCAEELATIWHFPIVSSKSPTLKKTEAKRAEPPSSLPSATRGGGFRPAMPRTVEAEPPTKLPLKKEFEENEYEDVPENLPFA